MRSLARSTWRWYSSGIRTVTRRDDNIIHPSLKYSSDLESVVGLEIHCQINSCSKLFSPSSTAYKAGPNTNVDPFDASMPGTLPVINRSCVEAAIFTGLALNCRIPSFCSFDRKHYFYADLPAGYQITQQREPIAVDGFIEFPVYTEGIHREAYVTRSVLKQIQLEQDSGKSLHDEVHGTSLIDLNRAGVGLMELVFEPDLTDGEEAAHLVRELMLILRRLNTCSCKLAEGALRVDANISVHRPGEPLGVRTELKNLNSLRAVTQGINYEIGRQMKLVDSGEKVINDTRTFDVERNISIVMRDKEVVQDYRFLPDPNLPRLRLLDTDDGSLLDKNDDTINIHDMRCKIPKFPPDDRHDLMERYNFSLKDTMKLVSESGALQIFEAIMTENSSRNPNDVFQFLMNEVFNVLDEYSFNYDTMKVPVSVLGECIDLIDRKLMTLPTGEDVLHLIVKGDQRRPENILTENGWQRIVKEEDIRKECERIIASTPKKARIYANRGKILALHSLLHNLKKVTNNKVDANEAKAMFRDILKPPTKLK